MNARLSFLFIIIFFKSLFSFAVGEAPQTFSLSGTLYQAGTTRPLKDPQTKILVQILNPNKTCLLYEEMQTISVGENGFFNIQVGSAIGSGKRTVNDPGQPMSLIFQNTGMILSANLKNATCIGGIYTPSPGDTRYIRLTVTPSSTNVPDQLTPDLTVNSSPSALVAQSVQGLERNRILQFKESSTITLNQNNLEWLFNNTNFSKLQTLLGGGLIAGSNSGVALPSVTSNPSSPIAGSIWYDSVNKVIKYSDGTTVQTVGSGGGGGGGGPLTESDIPNLTTAGKVSGSAINSGAIGGTTSFNTSGNLTTSGTVTSNNVSTNAIYAPNIYGGSAPSANLTLDSTSDSTKGKILIAPTNGNVGIGTSTPSTKLDVQGTSGNTLKIVDGNQGAGKVLTSDANGVASWQAPAGGGGGGTVTSVTAAGTAGNPITVTNTTTTPAIDIAAATGSNNGYLSSTDWTTFNSKLGTSTSFSGDVSGNYNSTSVDKIKGKSVSATAPTASGQVLRYDGTSTYIPSFLSLADIRSTVTPANTMFPASTCTSAQTMTWSSLTDTMTCSNIAVAASAITSGTLAVANGGTGTSDGSITGTGALTFAAGGTNQNVSLTPSGTGYTLLNGKVGIGTATPSSMLEISSGDIQLTSGNKIKFASAYTSEAYDSSGVLNMASPSGVKIEMDSNSNGVGSFAIVEAGTSRLKVDAGGNVGIGTTSPSATLHIASSNIDKDSVLWGNLNVFTSDSQGSNIGGTIALGGEYGGGSARGFAAISGRKENSTSSNLSGYLAFYTHSDPNTVLNERMRIDSSGNVGIGTNNPGQKLEVNGSVKITDGNQATGKVLTSDANGVASWQTLGGFTGAVNITSTPYTITSSDNGKAYYYSNNANGIVNLPALSGVSNGFSVTITREVAKTLTITPNGSDKFPGGITTVEMQGKNLQSITVIKLGSTWKLVNQTEECTIGQECWTADSTGGMKQIFVGAYGGHQYFTTPSGCTDSATPTCAGGTDSVGKNWANNSGTTAYNVSTGATNMTFGGTQSDSIASSYTDTDAAKFCANMNYAGYTDWFLPSRQELTLLYQNSATIGGFSYSSSYWSSTEHNLTKAWSFSFNDGYVDSYSSDKTYSFLVRCIRRF